MLNRNNLLVHESNAVQHLHKSKCKLYSRILKFVILKKSPLNEDLDSYILVYHDPHNSVFSIFCIGLMGTTGASPSR